MGCDGRRVGEELVGPVCLGEGVLGGQQPLGRRTVPLALGVLLEGIPEVRRERTRKIKICVD